MDFPIGPTLGFNRFKTEEVIIAVIELLLRIRKGSSTSVGCVFGTAVRLLSGMQAWQPNKVTASHADGHNLWLVMLIAPEPRMALFEVENGPAL